MTIRLQRQLGYHLVQTYIPSVVFVTLSWLSLLVSPDSIAGKLRGPHIHIYIYIYITYLDFYVTDLLQF